MVVSLRPRWRVWNFVHDDSGSAGAQARAEQPITSIVNGPHLNTSRLGKPGKVSRDPVRVVAAVTLDSGMLWRAHRRRPPPGGGQTGRPTPPNRFLLRIGLGQLREHAPQLFRLDRLEQVAHEAGLPAALEVRVGPV